MSLLKGIQDKVITAAREVTQREIMPRFLRVTHEHKPDGSIFSEADLASQRFLNERLRAIHDVPVLGEEMPEDEQRHLLTTENDGIWCVDPIDGTTNFVSGIPFFAVSISLLIGGKPRVGVTYNPSADEMFYAHEDGGAYLNGIRLPLRQSPHGLAQCVAGVDFKRIPQDLGDALATHPPFFSQRSFGSSALEWCYVAAGRLDLYLHGGQMMWDYAAGSLILREAGGHMCTLDNDDFHASAAWKRAPVCALNRDNFVAWRDWLATHGGRKT